jgi:hypothetical protein
MTLTTFHKAVIGMILAICAMILIWGLPGNRAEPEPSFGLGTNQYMPEGFRGTLE